MSSSCPLHQAKCLNTAGWACLHTPLEAGLLEHIFPVVVAWGGVAMSKTKAPKAVGVGSSAVGVGSRGGGVWREVRQSTGSSPVKCGRNPRLLTVCTPSLPTPEYP